jgi:hypothetical protein
MVDKTPTKHWLKLHWLPTLGFSNGAHQAILVRFYFGTVETCGEVLNRLTLQEMGLLYGYVNICLEALVDK